MAKKKTKEPIDYSKPLDNPRYEQFCLAYMRTNNATQAAKDAKYSEKGADVRGAQLLGIISIKNRLALLQAKLAEESGISVTNIINGFRKIAFGNVSKELTNRNKLRALENLGKHLGFYGKDNEQRKEAPPTLIVHDNRGKDGK